MSRLIRAFNRYPFFIRLFNWEYWPFNLVYIPVAIYFTWLAIKARSFFFFSASNPSIETGGMFGESKWKIFELIPKHYYPKTVLVAEGAGFSDAQKAMIDGGIVFPVIAKPDRGERGWMVKRIETLAELQQYHQQIKVDYLIQTLVDYPIEMSVFYYRMPGMVKGVVSSVVTKQMLSVTGNGYSTLLELIKDYPRALLQLPILKNTFADKLKSIPAKGERIELVPIGNHSKGAMFIDACHVIDGQLSNVFDDISKQIQGFYFGRYDIRCPGIDELKQGRGIQILELNGAGAEPAHIYHPGFSLWKAYGVLFYHFKVLYHISLANKQNGVAYMTLQEYRAMQQLVNQYNRKAGK